MLVTFTNLTPALTANEGETININFGYTVTLTPEELLEPEPNSIVSKTLIISPTSSHINILETETDFTLSGSFSLDDFNANINYVDKGKSDKNQTPVIATKYSSVPDSKEVYKIQPLETSKVFNLIMTLKDKNNISYIQEYTLTVNIKNNSISNWIKNYYQERY